MPETESAPTSSSLMSDRAAAPPIGDEIRGRLTQEPADADLHVACAQCALQAGRPDIAKARLLRALSISQLSAPLHANLAILSGAPQARRAMRRALALAPAAFPFHANLSAMTAFTADRRVLHGRRALAIDACDPGATLNLALALNEADGIGEAIAILQSATQTYPRSVDLRFTLGGFLVDVGETTRAWRELRCAAALAPRDAGVWLRMARIASSAADPGAATTAVARAVTIDPWTPSAWSTRLMVSLYDHRTTPIQELGFAKARRRAERRPILPRPPTRRISGSPLHIGYVSADFWKHPVAYNIAPAIEAHDRSRLRITCYADVMRPDAMTRHLSERADGWRDVAGIDDEALARQIRTDGIDVLVVLAGNTARNRIGVASFRPAPVQLSLLDVASSGSPEIDGIIVDPLLCPPSGYAAVAERPMPVSCLFCFTVPEESAVPDRRRDQDEFVFGSFSNPAKLGPATIALWASLLRAVPYARLLLKYKNLYDDRYVQAQIREGFAAAGVGPSSIAFTARVDDRAAHLDFYNQVDIALDPVPFNGCTTTFEALWMGVPVLTRTSGRMMGRMGASILSAAGLEDLIAEDDATFVAKGLELVAATDRRQMLRQDLRRRLRVSRLIDGRPFARELEAVFEQAYRAFLPA